MEEHPALVTPSYPLGPSLTKADKEALWLQLKALLDAEGPARKTVQQWQAFWRKQRFYADQALALVRQQQRGTGGGQLAGIHGRILQLTGTARVDGGRAAVYGRSEALVPPDESLQARALAGDFRRPQPIQPLPAQPTVSVGETPGTSGLQSVARGAGGVAEQDAAQECLSAPARKLESPCPVSCTKIKFNGITHRHVMLLTMSFLLNMSYIGFCCEKNSITCMLSAPQRQRRRRVPPAGAREALPRLVELHTRSSEQQQQTNTLIAELREAATRQAVALEQLATEARLHREAGERQATALEAILQQQGQALQELRSVGALSRAIAAALRRPAQ
ncbi:uncharacterized protein LOC142581782 isoform X1 [Dermacentor variabilis]|uniref:uncharacterized protein LOC142581782 isoform X1 n=1 Tax=Dermacentor variabilis TaxID=34621 RepID=UPI003F5BF9FF